MVGQAVPTGARLVKAQLASLVAEEMEVPAYADAVHEALRLHLAVDGFALFATDPATMLWTGGTVRCHTEVSSSAFIENELLEDDFAKYASLARERRGVATLLQSTGGEPERSPRFRRLLAPLGYRHELRAALRVGGACWGVLCLVRSPEAGDFEPADVRMVEELGPAVAHGLRRSARALSAGGVSDVGPGTILLDETGAVLAMTSEAAHWLGRLPKEPGTRDTVPQAVSAVAVRALGDGHRLTPSRSSAPRGGPGHGRTVRARFRSRAGGWLQVQASALYGRADRGTTVSVVIEPMPAGQVAAVLSLAFELSRREREVLVLTLRGCTVEEMTRSLFISRHTVRDHLKSIYAKTGATSRAELSAMVLTTLGELGSGPLAEAVPSGPRC